MNSNIVFPHEKAVCIVVLLWALFVIGSSVTGCVPPSGSSSSAHSEFDSDDAGFGETDAAASEYNNVSRPDPDEDCEAPPLQGASQRCCRVHESDACKADYFCALLDEQAYPTCLPNFSRYDNDTCYDDVHCGSRQCHPTQHRCLSSPRAMCWPEVGCSDAIDGARYLCIDERCQLSDGDTGAPCLGPDDCTSGYCVGLECTSGDVDSPCNRDEQCISGQCTEGVCEPGCDEPLLSCSGTCVDTQRDKNHCGQCELACLEQGVCSRGTCEWATQVESGYFHTCALLSNGTVKCWGSNTYGQLGNNTLIHSVKPVDVLSIDDAAQIVAGYGHACALLSDNSVKCWGNNAEGQLGDGTFTNRSIPVAVDGVTTALQLSAGGRHTCAKLVNGQIVCWGQNNKGQLGNGLFANSSTPVSVGGLGGVIQLAGGGTHTCALRSDYTVRCWGENSDGQLGDGTKIVRTSPTTIISLSNATHITAGALHSCARLSNGTVKCWGNSDHGQLGYLDSTDLVDYTTPLTVPDLTGVADISAGFGHSCAIQSSGGVKCWGGNSHGQLGDGSRADSARFVSVDTLLDVIQVTTGYYHTCALLSDNSVKCWGYNHHGQLGTGTNASSLSPRVVKF